MKATIDRDIANTLYAHIFITFRVCLFSVFVCLFVCLFVCFKVYLYVCLIVSFSRVSCAVWNLILLILFMPSRFIKLFYPHKQMSKHKRMVFDITVNPMCVCVGGGGYVCSFVCVCVWFDDLYLTLIIIVHARLSRHF